MIKKVSETTPTMASIVNGYSTSTQDGYSCDYVNDCNTYSTSETFTGKYWTDGKPIYRRLFTGITIGANSGDIDILTLSNYSIDTIIDISKSYLLTASNEKWYAPSTYYGFVGNEYYFFSLWATSTTIRAKTSGSSIRGTIYLILEYTKTS